MITATYSVEDNKLRLYSTTRLDQETYEKVKALGFKWAPKQELFIAPKWTPKREDLCIELAGEIESEETTLAERAEAKAARIDEAIENKQRQANAFSKAADSISERFAYGQPILVGHHSERKARKDHEKMDRAMRNASDCIKTAQWLAYKAEGVEAHANYKNRSDVRARRIKTLLAELRDCQRQLNHGHIIKGIWEKISVIEDIEKKNKSVEHYCGIYLQEGPMSPRDTYGKLMKSEISHEEVITLSLEYADKWINSKSTMRWIDHLLNRLAYERSELGETKFYEGPLRETILQMFAREQGAHKPEATKTDKGFKLTSSVPLPFHIANGLEIELCDIDWRHMMKSCGYEVQEKVASGKSDQIPLLNLKVKAIKSKKTYGERTFQVEHITKEQFSKISKDYKSVHTSSCGTFRFRTGYNPNKPGQYELVAYFITDSKAHDIPESEAIILETANE